MRIVKAIVEDHTNLTTITKMSKAYWDYSEQELENWSELLTITEEYIQSYAVYKLVDGEKIIGYYSYFEIDEDAIKLDALFIAPKQIGKGFGKLLIADFLERIKSTRIEKIILDSDPNVEMFYAKFGFVKIGLIATSIKERYLPLMELKL